MAFALRCPDCRKAFKWNPAKDYPDHCILCGADMATDKSEDDTVIVMPAFLSAKTKSVDQVGRDLMDSSIVRAEKAAEMAGVPVSEMSDMKITDLKSTQHEGSVAHVPVQNAVTQAMDAINARGGQVGWQGSQGVEYSGAVQTGPFPNMGAKMRTMIHQKNGSISERPGLETTAPNYVRRG